MALEFATVSVVPYRMRILREAWNQIDQQAIDLDTRKTLIRNGVRAGLTGQAIPPALRSLMKPRLIDRSTLTDVQKEMLDRGILEPDPVMNSHTRLSMLPERSRDLPILGARSELVWQWSGSAGNQHYRFENAASLIRTTMSPLNVHEVSIGLIPIVKHGQPRPRFNALEDQLALQVDQSEQILSEARLSCHLRCGETLMLGPDVASTDRSTPTMGQAFFQDPVSPDCQTVVLLRLLDSNASEMFG